MGNDGYRVIVTCLYQQPNETFVNKSVHANPHGVLGLDVSESCIVSMYVGMFLFPTLVRICRSLDELLALIESKVLLTKDLELCYFSRRKSALQLSNTNSLCGSSSALEVGREYLGQLASGQMCSDTIGLKDTVVREGRIGYASTEMLV